MQNWKQSQEAYQACLTEQKAQREQAFESLLLGSQEQILSAIESLKATGSVDLDFRLKHFLFEEDEPIRQAAQAALLTWHQAIPEVLQCFEIYQDCSPSEYCFMGMYFPEWLIHWPEALPMSDDNDMHYGLTRKSIQIMKKSLQSGTPEQQCQAFQLLSPLLISDPEFQVDVSILELLELGCTRLKNIILDFLKSHWQKLAIEPKELCLKLLRAAKNHITRKKEVLLFLQIYKDLDLHQQTQTTSTSEIKLMLETLFQDVLLGPDLDLRCQVLAEYVPESIQQAQQSLAFLRDESWESQIKSLGLSDIYALAQGLIRWPENYQEILWEVFYSLKADSNYSYQLLLICLPWLMNMPIEKTNWSFLMKDWLLSNNSLTRNYCIEGFVNGNYELSSEQLEITIQDLDKSVRFEALQYIIKSPYLSSLDREKWLKQYTLDSDASNAVYACFRIWPDQTEAVWQLFLSQPQSRNISGLIIYLLNQDSLHSFLTDSDYSLLFQREEFETALKDYLNIDFSYGSLFRMFESHKNSGKGLLSDSLNQHLLNENLTQSCFHTADWIAQCPSNCSIWQKGAYWNWLFHSNSNLRQTTLYRMCQLIKAFQHDVLMIQSARLLIQDLYPKIRLAAYYFVFECVDKPDLALLKQALGDLDFHIRLWAIQIVFRWNAREFMTELKHMFIHDLLCVRYNAAKVLKSWEPSFFETFSIDQIPIALWDITGIDANNPIALAYQNDVNRLRYPMQHPIFEDQDIWGDPLYED